MTQFYEWTKKLGQQHWSIPNEHGTLCGMPMLGNNYARVYDQEDKTPCRSCAERKDFIETGEAHD